MAKTNYTFNFYCINNSGKKQIFKVKAPDKMTAIDKGFQKAKKNAKGDITNWECRFVSVLS